MRNIFVLLLLFVITTAKAQEKPIDVTKIKTCTTLDCLLQDSVFMKVLNEVKISPTKYQVVDVTEIVSLTDSLIIAKLSHTTISFNVYYKTLDELVVNSYESKSSYISNSVQKKIYYKKLMCYRTLSPNEKGKYKVHIYLLQ